MQLFKVGPVPGKGLGVTASAPIQRAQQVMKERPLIESPANVVLSSPSLNSAIHYFAARADQLSPDKQDVFYSLSDWRNEQAGLPKTAYHVFRSNALPKGKGMVALLVVQLFMRRFVASTTAVPRIAIIAGMRRKDVRLPLFLQAVHALTSIKPGTELGVTYIELFASNKDRRKILEQKFGFICSCSACTAQGNQLQESNERRVRLAELDKQIRDNMEKQPEKSMNALAEFATLFAEEGITDTYFSARVHGLAHEICIGRPDLGSAHRHAKLALKDFTISEGAEGDGARQLRQWLEQNEESLAAAAA